MPERSNGAVSKTAVLCGTGGSNPPTSAIFFDSNLQSVIFQLGGARNLSLLEIEKVFPNLKFEKNFTENFAEFSGKNFTAKNFEKLGGAVRVLQFCEFATRESLPEKIANKLQVASCKLQEKKINFAISAFGAKKLARNLKSILLKTKKILREKNFVARFANRNFENFSTTQFSREKNFTEFCVVFVDGKFAILQTIAAQNVENFAARDFKKKARSMEIGMLPVKMARVFLNLTREKSGSFPTKIFDPFCGTGTIPVEAHFLGAEKIFAADVSPESLRKTRENLAHFRVENCAVFSHDATTHFPENVDDAAIATETFLGPIFPRKLSETDFKTARGAVEPILEKFLENVARGKFSTAVIAIPFWRGENGEFFFLEKILARADFFWKNVRRDLLFIRANQFVGRQVLILKDAQKIFSN